MTDSRADAGCGRNVYDAEGERMLRRDPDGTTTLYLDSTEIRQKGATQTAQRWYSFNGRVVMTRTQAGLAMLAPDHHGTGQAQIAARTGVYVKRRFDPFGSPRRGAGTGAWSGDRGFLDKSRDLSGLTQVGARYYDTGLGRFISVDPVLTADDPQQLNGYQYGGNNPVTNSDPTGEQILPGAPPEQAANHVNPRPSGGGGSWTAPSPPARTPVAVRDTSFSASARNIVDSVMFYAASAPVADGSEFLDKVSPIRDQFDPRGRRARGGVPWWTRADRARAAHRFTSGEPLPGRHKIWQQLKVDKVAKFLGTSKLVRGAGIAGGVISTISSFATHKRNGDTTTEAALKAGIEGSITAGTATLAASFGGACGPAAPVCSAGLGAGGAVIGAAVGKGVTQSLDSQIGWTAGKIDDFGTSVAHIDWTPW